MRQSRYQRPGTVRVFQSPGRVRCHVGLTAPSIPRENRSYVADKPQGRNLLCVLVAVEPISRLAVDNGLVTLRIDASRALRTHHSHVELVKAIVAAPESTQETYAVEWKTEVDLADRGWRARLAKGVLGFANRDPALVTRWFEGCAYLVVGACPGRLVGTTVVDAAKVEAALAPYVGKGPDGPDWSSSYVDVDGKSVLILTVEPPRLGSRIWTLQKEYAPTKGEALRAADIFVRHQASTERASQSDIDMLTRRAASGGTQLGGLTVLLPAKAAAVPIDIRDETVAAWLDSEREALKLPPEPPPEPKRVIQVPSDPAARKLLTREDILKSADFGTSIGKMMRMREPRSREKYQAELDAYLTKAGERLPGVLLRSAVRRELGRIALTVRNDTLDNYHAVEVELYIDVAGVLAFFDSGDIGGRTLPGRPVEWGKGGGSAFDAITSFRMPYVPRPIMPNVSIPRGRIDNSHSSRITLHPADVRPKRTADLDEFYLLVHPEHAGTTLTATWTATATDASGSMEGTFNIPVAARVPTTDELLSDAYDDDGDIDLDDE